MFLGQDIPKCAVTAGGVCNYKDGRTAPDSINATLEYPADLTATFEATLVPGITGAAIEFCGTNGKLYIDRQKYIWTPVPPRGTGGRAAAPEAVTQPAIDNMDVDHVNNFLECVRTRKLPNGDV